ncbi:sigma-70 family RNA polymerase sigma factor [Megasphaera sp.]|jgi:RNA polymerase sigma factor (sigma-70 family)|uniref:sigma-70 family RNA polymerase sigma factor n=1 Tax=Megasphaera sp. TaxID=2023260 RepID=UPI0025BC7677|nr:sigma-70 family RNA polymerase sigma factor [Megasphaera sp.]
MTIQMRHCVRAAQRGDKIAAEELIKAFKPYLHHQAKKYQRFYQNFDEALSTAYHGAIDCIYQYDLSQSETVTEMMVASVHNHLRRESYSRTCYYQRVEKTIMENNTLTDLPEDLVSEDACPELRYLEDEVRTQLYWALEQLPELQQKFIRLHFIHGYSYKQIAQKYDFRKSTVGDYVKRGLLRMKILLANEHFAS